MSNFACTCVVLLGFVSLWGSIVLESTVIGLTAWCGMAFIVVCEAVRAVLRKE